jgi:hypothetical protein
MCVGAPASVASVFADRRHKADRMHELLLSIGELGRPHARLGSQQWRPRPSMIMICRAAVRVLENTTGAHAPIDQWMEGVCENFVLERSTKKCLV